MNEKLLYENDEYSLFYLYEQPVLKNRQTEKEHYLRKHYGDPCCGLIDRNNKICVVGGQGLNIIKLDDFSSIDKLDGLFIHSIKQEDNEIKILIDPWSDDSGIWSLEIETLVLKKISNDPDLRNCEYKEEVDF